MRKLAIFLLVSRIQESSSAAKLYLPMARRIVQVQRRLKEKRQLFSRWHQRQTNTFPLGQFYSPCHGWQKLAINNCKPTGIINYLEELR